MSHIHSNVTKVHAQYVTLSPQQSRIHLETLQLETGETLSLEEWIKNNHLPEHLSSLEHPYKAMLKACKQSDPLIPLERIYDALAHLTFHFLAPLNSEQQNTYIMDTLFEWSDKIFPGVLARYNNVTKPNIRKDDHSR